MQRQSFVHTLLFSAILKLSRELSIYRDQDPEAIATACLLQSSLDLHGVGDNEIRSRLSRIYPDLNNVLDPQSSIVGRN